MFDPDNGNPYRTYGPDRVDTLPHRSLALTAARQGMTLVKNDNKVLPFKNGMSLAVVGPHCNATIAMQSNYHGQAPYIVSPIDGLSKFATVTAVEGTGISGPTRSSTIADAAAAASKADATVILIGLDGTIEGEGHDRYTIDLPGNQTDLIDAVSAASAGPVIIVFIGGGAVDLSAYKTSSKVGAILIAGYPGQEGGNAIAETIFGVNNPAGRLTQTWYAREFIQQCSFFDMNVSQFKICGML